MSQEAVERALMEWLLAGDHPMLATLRAQYAAAEIDRRELSGVGCFVHYRVPIAIPRVPGSPTAIIDDVAFGVEGTENGGLTLLWIENGVLSYLELVMWTEKWPAVPALEHVYYIRDVPHERWEGRNFEPAADRDWDHLARALWS
jgi:hypothetical protein